MPFLAKPRSLQPSVESKVVSKLRSKLHERAALRRRIMLWPALVSEELLAASQGH